MRDWSTNEKAIIINTEEYAGNFERELIAFITGLTGDCGVGVEAAAIAKKELPAEAVAWFDDNVEQTADEHGCNRPASVAPTPGWYNNGTGTHRRLKDSTKKPKYAAYLSVEFVVTEWPPDNIMEVITARARTFCQRFNKEHDELSRFSDDGSGVEIPFTGIRWEERTVTTKTVKHVEV